MQRNEELIVRAIKAAQKRDGAVFFIAWALAAPSMTSIQAFSRFRGCQSPVLLFYTVVFAVSCWSDFIVSFFRDNTDFRTGLGFYASTSILTVNMTLVMIRFMFYKYFIDSDRGYTITPPPYEQS